MLHAEGGYGRPEGPVSMLHQGRDNTQGTAALIRAGIPLKDCSYGCLVPPLRVSAHYLIGEVLTDQV